MTTLSAFITGLVFGLGLILSGMTDPAKVIGFLDLTGMWNPSLALVMGGALVIGFIAYRFGGQRPKSLLGAAMRIPTARHIDRRLVVGSITFGMGWGLAGYCPGPALASLGTGMLEPIIFTLAMIAGMALFEIQDRFASGGGKLAKSSSIGQSGRSSP